MSIERFLYLISCASTAESNVSSSNRSIKPVYTTISRVGSANALILGYKFLQVSIVRRLRLCLSTHQIHNVQLPICGLKYFVRIRAFWSKWHFNRTPHSLCAGRELKSYPFRYQGVLGGLTHITLNFFRWWPDFMRSGDDPLFRVWPFDRANYSLCDFLNLRDERG